MSYVIYSPVEAIARDSGDAPESGAKLWFREFDTTTPVTVYQDSAGSIPHANPVLSLSDGAWPAIYWDNSVRTRVLKTGPAAINPNSPDWQVDDIGPTAGDTMARDGSNVAMTDGQATAFREAIKIGETYCNVKVRYGLNGNGATSDGDKIQTAFDTEPPGTTMYFPQGTYARAGGSWQITKLQNIKGDGKLTIFRGDHVEADKSDIFAIDIVAIPEVYGDVRQLLIENITIYASGLGSRYGIAINPNPAGFGIAHHNTTIRNCGISGSRGNSILINGLVNNTESSFNTIEECTLEGTIRLINVTDGNRIINNSILGDSTGIVLDLIVGAFNTLISGNAIVTRDGALQIINGSFVNFLDNQCEQKIATNDLGMMLKVGGVEGSLYTSKYCRVLRNNFGGGAIASLGQTIRLDDARGWLIDQNQFNPSNTGGDVVFGPASHYNTIGPNNACRGVRFVIVPVDIDTLILGTDATRRLMIYEYALARGNRGIWRPGPTLQNAWTNDVMEYLINGEGEVCLSGGATAGAITPGTLICTLPLSSRPMRTTYIPVGTSTGPGQLMVATTGAVTVVALPQADFDTSGQGFRANWIDDYDPAPL